MSHRTRSVLWLLAAVTLLVFPLVPTAGQRDLVQTLVTAAALVVAWQHLRERRDLAGRGWGLVLVAVSVLGLSDAMLAAERHLFHYVGHPQPSNIVYVVDDRDVIRISITASRAVAKVVRICTSKPPACSASQTSRRMRSSSSINRMVLESLAPLMVLTSLGASMRSGTQRVLR